MPTTMMKLLDYDPKTGGRLSHPMSIGQRAVAMDAESNSGLLDIISAAALVLGSRRSSQRLNNLSAEIARLRAEL